MSMKISEMKREARQKLNGKWITAILINLVHLVLTGILLVLALHLNETLIFAQFILLILSLIIAVPLNFGLIASMLKLYRDESTSATDFINIGYKNFGRAFKLYLSIFIRVFLPVLLVIVSLVVLVIGIATTTLALFYLSLALAVIALVWYCYLVLAYALTTYLCIDNPDATCKQVIAKSKELMHGKKAKYVLLILSFIGWFLLSVIICAIVSAINVTVGDIVVYALSLLLTPYITFAQISFYEKAAGIADVTVVQEAEVKTEE